MRRWSTSLLVTVLGAAALVGEGIAGAACPTSAIRWASSSRSLYVTGSVTCTLTDIDAVAPSDALRLVDSSRKIWLLRAKLIIQQGAALVVRGSAAGGDANELRLVSNDSSASGSIIYIRAQWGRITFDHTKVTSWDEHDGGPDTHPSSHGRSYIHARSFLDSDGTARESRMDISDSEISYLGYNAAESYGLVWKVIGSSSGLYSKVDVLGDVTDSRIHHNYFGAYTFGAFGMHWLRNEIDHNVQYGLDPHDDSDELVITDNEVHDNGNHGIICSQRCNDLIISRNHSYQNATHGIMIHRGVTDSVLEDNVVEDNGDTGIAVFESSGNVLRNNHISGNLRGIRLSVGSADNLFEGNEIEGSSQYAIYFYKGSDTPTSGDGHPKRNTFTDNFIHDNARAVKATMADENEFIDNTFVDNDEGFLFVDCEENVLSGNAIPSDSRISTDTSDLSDASTIITSAPGSLLIESTDGGITRFVETSTRTHKVSGTNVATVVTSSQGTLTLTRSQTSSARTVSAVNLYTSIGSGTLRVTPMSWSTSTTGAKSWTAKADSGTITATFRLTGLASSTSYAVRRNGSSFKTVTSSSSGVLSFIDSVDGSTISYTVQLP